VACFYYLKLLASIYAKPEDEASQDASSVAPAERIGVPAGIGLTLAAAATLMLGIFPGRVLHLANNAGETLRPDAAQGIAGASPAAPQVSPVFTVKQ
jgi:NADH-quinone oxidoreductase subunit N